MNINDFINQRKIVNYNQKDHLANLHQFLFFLKEVKFSNEELMQSVPYFDRVPSNIADDNFIFHTPSNKKENQYFSNAELANELKTHIGTEAIRAVRDSFSAIYPYNKIKKTSTPQEIEKIKENVSNITCNFFEIMKYISHLNMPNIPTFITNGHFGSNIVANYHESLILLAMHNYSQFDMDKYASLVEEIIPNNSLSNPKFIKLFTSILYNDDKAPLFEVLLSKIDKKQFVLACLTQTKNHKNYFVGLKLFIQNTDRYLSDFPEYKRKEIINNIFSNLSLIGMLNNGYYVKTFTAEDKIAFSKFIEKLPNNNNIIYELAGSHRFQNIDFEALVSKPIISNSKLISIILIKSNTNKKHNLSYLLQYFAKDELISFTEIGKNLASLSESSFIQLLDIIRTYFSQQNILQMMNSDVRLFKNLEPLYREKNLQKALTDKTKETPSVRAKSKI